MVKNILLAHVSQGPCVEEVALPSLLPGLSLRFGAKKVSLLGHDDDKDKDKDDDTNTTDTIKTNVEVSEGMLVDRPMKVCGTGLTIYAVDSVLMPPPRNATV